MGLESQILVVLVIEMGLAPSALSGYGRLFIMQLGCVDRRRNRTSRNVSLCFTGVYFSYNYELGVCRE